MVIVLVHGVPETERVWDPLVEALRRAGIAEPIRLSPPGFGAPVPPGWHASVQGYRDWLVAELEQVDGPVDLVGHDWGGGHVLGVAMTRPDLIRSWVSDVPGIFDPEYVWHDQARRWQGADRVEEVAALVGSTSEDRARLLVQQGMAPDSAAAIAPGIDAAMGACILDLYRSALQPVMALAGADLARAAERPGLALLPTADSAVGTDLQRSRAALVAGARTERLDGLGHWWMTTDPAAVAPVLVDFWNSIR